MSHNTKPFSWRASEQYEDNHTGHAPFPDYRTDFRYSIEEGVLILPVAGPPGTAPKIVRTHAPYMIKRAEWTSERFNEKTILPHWDIGANDIPIRLEWNAMSPQPGMGDNVTRIDGEYSYVSAVPPNKETLELFTGRPPHVKWSYDFLIYRSSEFDRNILRKDGGDGGRLF